MARIGELDLCDRLAPVVPRWLTEISVGLLCALAAQFVRFSLDLIAPGAAAFALIYPAVMLSTLFAGWRAGAITATTAILYSWYYVYPIRNSFRFVDAAGAYSLATVIVAAVLNVVVADLFRRAVRSATRERDRQIAERDLYLAEFDHRVKNNFAIVAGLLDLQKRRAADPATVAALGAAQQRVDSIARAHRHLYRGASSDPGTVEMRDYLPDLCNALAEALFLSGGIRLSCACDEAAVSRDRAVSVGLVVNELVTNASKHAFPGRDHGHITVTFRNRPGGMAVIVADDGVGLPDRHPASSAGTGLGSRLTEAFARQAGGTIQIDSDRTGTRVTLDLGR